MPAEHTTIRSLMERADAAISFDEDGEASLAISAESATELLVDMYVWYMGQFLEC